MSIFIRGSSRDPFLTVTAADGGDLPTLPTRASYGSLLGEGPLSHLTFHLNEPHDISVDGKTARVGPGTYSLVNSTLDYLIRHKTDESEREDNVASPTPSATEGQSRPNIHTLSCSLTRDAHGNVVERIKGKVWSPSSKT
ncbi:hypothetical protein GWC77_23490 [Paraburkholderia sp. NMBU_R16]|uniref:hypothetical protein n=1 Tax=Paraburkholderia sp. NMBU_R16 TaxID=2698676 RepID=UPI0015647E64|nr:hypothetical protein [Paraburkholderia sp. NMBU_R16]NRO98877.1 hypothetical protein [Paraburkholderia sp. NMBU_R16]